MKALAVAFFSGFAVLLLEILGARLVSPVYGATVYVWSSLILVTLAALAAGYALGGLLADRNRPWPALGLLLALSGLWLAAVPALRRWTLMGTLPLGVQWGALACAAFLLGLPLLCLGAVGPLCVRLRLKGLDSAGRELGAVSAVSTLGSVLGALLAGFYLIPRFPLSSLLLVLAAALGLGAAFCFKTARRRGAGAACALAALGALAGAARLGPRAEGNLLWSESSFYGEIKVADARELDRRILYIDGMPNTVVRLGDLESVSEYILSFEILPFLRPEGRRGLLLGVGGGALPGRFLRHYGVGMDVVDIDDKVVEAARRFFAFKPTGEVFLEDGRAFLERGGPRYDFIVVDAFNGDQHPAHLFTREAFAAARGRLEPGGVLAINAIGYVSGPRAALRRSFERTLREVFPHVRVFVANGGVDPDRDYANLTLLASEEPLTPRRDPRSARPEFAAYWKDASARFLDEEAPRGAAPSGALLTDDFNPVEALSAASSLEIRADLLRRLGQLMAY